MKKSRILSGMISAALSLNCVVSGSLSAAAYEPKSADTAIDYRYVGNEHAYDPLAEYQEKENEKRFRETAAIDGNKLVFSVIERSECGVDLSSIYKEFGLYNISKVYETEHGSDPEVFYEAQTSSDDVWETVDKLLENDDIISAEPVFKWSKASVGKPVEVPAEEFERETHYSLLETKNVWDSLKNSEAPGKGAVVAVIDTGVDYEHKDLVDNIWTNTGEIAGNGIDDDGNGFADDIHGINALSCSGDPMDDHGHGTHVAGVIAMSAGNGGGVGLAYGAEIMCIKAGGADGTFASTDIARAIKYAVDNGADVINMSFGGEEKSSIVEAALNDAADYAVLVASAGNDGLPTSEASENGYKNVKNVYPAGYSNVIGVMASDNNDKLARFSNWDYLVGKGCEYEMTAPGVDIYSTLPDDRYAVWSGTSMSSACVAAAAALIRSEYPQKNKYDSRYIMGQLINASTSIASADPPVVTMPEIVTTTTTTSATSITTTTTTTTSTIVADDPIKNADVDGVAGITNDDFLYMLKGLVGLNSLGGKGDVNCDGTVDMYDAICILRLSSGEVSADEIVGQPTKNSTNIKFEVPAVDIVEEGDYTKYTFSYDTNIVFKAASGQLRYNGKPYSGEFENIELLQSSNPDFIYEFNPDNGKFVAYSAGNGNSGSLTIAAYEGKDGTYSLDLGSLKFFDENGKEFKDFDLVDFNPVMTLNSEVISVNAAGTPASVAVYDKHVEYPRLNIIDSLTRQPKPDIIVTSIDKLETADISEVNNGDGIVQPGETVELGISLLNRWGAASDVTVKIEAIGFDGKPNPYVEVLDDTVSLGDIGGFSGAEASLRVKVRENAPNDGKMEFKITVTSKNGFVSEDKSVYTTESEYSFIVQRISYLRGKIKKDITLDNSRYWIIKDIVTLMDNVTMTILPGTDVELAGYLYADNGELICNGTQDEPISLFRKDFIGGGCGLSARSSKINYTKITNIELYILSCDHCKIIHDRNLPGGDIRIQYASNSIFSDITKSHCSDWGESTQVYVYDSSNCLFNSEVLRLDSDNYDFNYSQDVFVRNFKAEQNFQMSDLFNPYYVRNINVLNNAFLNNYNDPYKRGIRFDVEMMNSIALNNYYGTEDVNDIKYVNDPDADYDSISESMLTLNSPEIESIYPFMTEAYLTNVEGEQVDSIYIGIPSIVHLKFNRDMVTNIQPDVSLGVMDYGQSRFYDSMYIYDFSSNYDEYIIKGDWASSREWVGYISIDEVIETQLMYGYDEGMTIEEVPFSGKLYIRSEGAVAADDRWLVTGNDGGRFGFNVVKPATIQTGDSETAKLSGKGVAGANQLTWSQDETETLAGYNLYRSVGDNTSFTKLNRTLLSGEDLQYKDTDVVEGQKYYYYFTTVDTDFHESSPSNIVEAIPLDAFAPKIVHTPVTYSEPNKALVITANVTDNVKVDSVELFYKYSDEADWNSVSMRNPSGSTYRTNLSAYEVRKGKLEYYIVASDGVSKSCSGTADEPNIIDIKPYEELTTTTSTTTSTTISSTTTSSTTSKTTSTTTSLTTNSSTTSNTTTLSSATSATT